MIRGALLLLAGLAAGAPARAADLSALDLARACQADTPSCTVYLRAALAMYEAAAAEHKELAWFCPPVDAPPASLRKHVVDWVAENGAPGAEVGAMAVVRAAFQDAFPCSE